MKALTVQQPWAWAVLSGRINFFMEPFPPKIRGYFLIHAGIAYDDVMHDWLENPDNSQNENVVHVCKFTRVA